jgi:aryl-alcohol dehydrogenase-like predicted oxidoreductase
MTHHTPAVFGFGSYRVNDTNSVHEAALRHALSCGVSIIDTSTNYTNGGSERLIGRVLADTTFVASLPSPPVIITKIGYAQGHVLEMIAAQKAMGQGYADVVEVADGLQHCIHPDFLDDMLAMSLGRLQRGSVDVLLLHNPEYYFQVAQQAGTPVEEARAIFYDRITRAFTWMEHAVQQGRIKNYGISSNTFVHDADAYDHVSLERCLEIAAGISSTHAFTHVQMPFNVIEHFAATTLNQAGGESTTLDVARQHNLTVLINRPLNALVGGDLIRLASHDIPLHTAGIHNVESRIHALETEEHEVLQIVLNNPAHSPREIEAVNEMFKIAGALCTSWNKFEGLIHWRDVKRSHLTPRLDAAIHYAEHSSDPDRVINYLRELHELLTDVETLYAAEENASLEELRDAVADELGLPMDTPLQQIALHAVRCTDGVNVVLVGMRTPEYVDDVLTTHDLPETTYHRTTWLRIADHLARLSEPS